MKEKLRELERQLSSAHAENAELRLMHDAARSSLEEAQTVRDTVRKSREELRVLNAQHVKDIAELKERLANSEAECQRMRGYIARVQEDDVVREELVKVGDVEGECNLTPKRKPTVFMSNDPYEMPRQDHAMGYRPERPRRRHWVTY